MDGGGTWLVCPFKGKQVFKYIGYYNLFEEEQGGGTKEVLDGYPCLKYLIQLWPGDWVRQMEKMNEAVCMKNRVTKNGGGKRLVSPFKRQQFWKFIGFILLEVTYGKKGHKLWSELPNLLVSMKILNYEDMFVETPIYIRYVVITIVIFTSMIDIELFYLTQLCSFHRCFFE